jgi:hypothetical protein
VLLLLEMIFVLMVYLYVKPLVIFQIDSLK